MNELTVHVTDEDIRDGVCGNVHRCAIANAVEREQIGSFNVSVGCNWIMFDTAEGHHRYVMPYEAKRFIQQFDGYEPVEPIKFTAKRDL